jgi:hypothetical protein
MEKYFEVGMGWWKMPAAETVESEGLTLSLDEWRGSWNNLRGRRPASHRARAPGEVEGSEQEQS